MYLICIVQRFETQGTALNIFCVINIIIIIIIISIVQHRLLIFLYALQGPKTKKKKKKNNLVFSCLFVVWNSTRLDGSYLSARPEEKKKHTVNLTLVRE